MCSCAIRSVKGHTATKDINSRSSRQPKAPSPTCCGSTFGGRAVSLCECTGPPPSSHAMHAKCNARRPDRPAGCILTTQIKGCDSAKLLQAPPVRHWSLPLTPCLVEAQSLKSCYSTYRMFAVRAWSIKCRPK